MERPTHLRSDPPAATFRMIEVWAREGARLTEASEDTTHACAFIFAAIAHCHPDIRDEFRRGLDRAQLYTGWPDDFRTMT